MKAPKSPTFPLEVKAGSVSVTIYRQADAGGSDLFTIAYYEGPKRKRESRRSFEDAWKRAEQVAGDINAGEAASVKIGGEERLVYSRAVKALESSGLSLDIAAQQMARLQEKLGGHSLEEAVAAFVRMNPVGLIQKSVKEVVDEFIATKRQDGCGELYLGDLKFRLGRFAADFQCPISSLGSIQIDDWLRALPHAGRGRNNYRTYIRTLWKYAVARKYASRDAVVWDDVATAQQEDVNIEIYSVTEIQKLISAARYETGVNGVDRRYAHRQFMLPVLVLGAFAGMRTSEIQAQMWEDINLERGFIRVTKAKRNTPQKRLIPISENLKAWLMLCRQGSGLVCKLGWLIPAMEVLARRSKVPWKKNALRHSYISYSVALTNDVAKVAVNAGNSPAVIFKHYRQLATPEEGAAWFSVAPSAPANVLAMPAEKVA